MKTTKTNPTKDPIINSVINQLTQRSAVGQKKYGVGLDRQDLTTDQWLQHAQDEALDLADYLEVLKTRTAETEAINGQLVSVVCEMRGLLVDMNQGQGKMWLARYKAILPRAQKALDLATAARSKK